MINVDVDVEIEFVKGKTYKAIENLKHLAFIDERGNKHDIGSFDEDVWRNFFELIIPNRPIIEHKHAKGEWYADKNTTFGEGEPMIVSKTQGVIANFTLSAFNTDEEAHATAKLMAISPALLQIVEMYFDSMKAKGKTDSIPFKLTLETLNKLK